MTTQAAPVQLRFSSVEDFVREHIRDPALDGLVIASSVALAPGTHLLLTIEFAPEKFIRTFAEVVGQGRTVDGKAGVAVRFVNLDPRYRQWLDKSVAAFKAQSQSAQTGHQLRKAVSGRELAGASENLTAAARPGELVLGIDLGTCNSAACVVVDGQPVIIDLRDEDDRRAGVRSIPSVVAIDDEGREVVGAKAQGGLQLNPRRTIFGAKRFIGRTYDSPAVQSMQSRFPYKVVPGPGGKVAVEINGRPMALTAISAKILAVIHKRAEKQLGRAIQKAIITVPAYYNDNQREAVVQAGRLAGLQVERVLNEPTAAAIAYGLTRSNPRRLLLFDLGGGTFDVSIMSVHRNSLTVLASAGDTFLGGEDFDNAIVKHISDEFTRKTKKQLSTNHAAMAIIKDAAEAAKRRLSVKDKTVISLKEVLLADRTTTKLEMELAREKLETLVEPLVARSLKICDMAMREAQLTAKDLGDVILVGGQTLMPYVQKRVRDHFKIAPRCDLNPDEVVALGAGMLAQLGGGPEGAVLKDVLSMSVGVAVAGRFKPIITRNTQVPCSRNVTLSVPKEKFTTYTLDVWQGDQQELHRNEHLGTLRLDAVKPGPVDPVPIRVDFFLTEDCLLKVRVTNTKTEESQQVLLTTRDSAR